MFGDTLYSVGIIVWYDYAGSNKYGWWAMVEFQDYGHCDPTSIRGSIKTSYGTELSHAVETIKKDAEALGIIFSDIGITPSLMYLNDNEFGDHPAPDGWRELLQKEAVRIGFKGYYAE